MGFYHMLIQRENVNEQFVAFNAFETVIFVFRDFTFCPIFWMISHQIRVWISIHIYLVIVTTSGCAAAGAAI